MPTARDLMTGGAPFDQWPSSLREFVENCEADDIEILLCGGSGQRNVFGHYDGTILEHVQTILSEVRLRATPVC